MGRRTLADRRVVITGASSGIGRALAETFARREARLLLTARREEALAELKETLPQQGAKAVEYVAGDITDHQLRSKVIETVKHRWAGLDLLINNAGVSAHGRFVDSDEQTLQRIMEVNLFAACELTRLALPLLREGRDPAIINLGSILGHRGVPFNSEYCASKFALRGWTEAIRAEVAADGIDVLLVSPGTTDTEFFEHLVAARGAPPWKSGPAIAPEAVAQQVARAIERGRREIFPNWRGRVLVGVNRLMPRLVDRLLERYGR